MHDPSTMICCVNIGKFPIFTVWHVDPETDGTDNSCGWFAPKLTDCNLETIEDMVEWDKKFPFYTSQATVHLSLPEDDRFNYLQLPVDHSLGYVAAAWQRIAWLEGRRRLTSGEWWAVVNLATNPDDNLRSILSDSEEASGERARRFLYCVMRQYMRYHRPWWRHPRWHVAHWQIQIHFIQTLKRWLFSRCAHCGRRFAWGYSPISSWGDGMGPRWFESEEGCYHHRCYNTVAKIIDKKEVDKITKE